MTVVTMDEDLRRRVDRAKREVRRGAQVAPRHGEVRVLLSSEPPTRSLEERLALACERNLAFQTCRQIDGDQRGGFATTMRHAR